MKCFYHSADLDGHCSGAIVKYFNPDCEMFGINYGDVFPWDKIGNGEAVFMVDFSLQPFADMEKLNRMCDLIWIDHHASAIKDSDGYHFGGTQRSGIGACELCWEYFDSGAVPQGIRLLAQYDVWNHSDHNTIPFQYGLRLENTIPNGHSIESLWGSLFTGVDGVVSDVVKNGRLVLEYVKQENQKYCSACSFETELDGLRCVAINKMLTNSQVFDSVWDNKKYDAMLTFGRRRGFWTVSLYTDKPGVDVSLIAKARGGGGHVQAAGFQCDSLPFHV